jgi:hypothetical protein
MELLQELQEQEELIQVVVEVEVDMLQLIIQEEMVVQESLLLEHQDLQD